jgi:shikimate dehydrogenase
LSVPPKAGVLGWPVAHSRSPLIHGFWLKTLGLAGSYEKLAVAPEDFSTFLAAMPSRGFVGGNVTIPHKAAAAARCDWLTEAAARLSSVNTLWFEGGKLCGDSTDGQGFLGALDQETPGWTADRGLALVLGAGGAAAPIVDALIGRGIRRVVVANRTPAKAEALARRLGCDAVGLDDVTALMPTVDLLVNTTSAGMEGQGGLALDLEPLPAHAIVDDIVYVPAVTTLLGAARARGLRTVGGLGMLLHQAAPGFARWFGVTPEVTPELRALVAADIV